MKGKPCLDSETLIRPWEVWFGEVKACKCWQRKKLGSWLCDNGALQREICFFLFVCFSHYLLICVVAVKPTESCQALASAK